MSHGLRRAGSAAFRALYEAKTGKRKVAMELGGLLVRGLWRAVSGAVGRGWCSVGYEGDRSIR